MAGKSIAPRAAAVDGWTLVSSTPIPKSGQSVIAWKDMGIWVYDIAFWAEDESKWVSALGRVEKATHWKRPEPPQEKGGEA